MLPILLVFQGIICGGEGEIENPDITKITDVPGLGKNIQKSRYYQNYSCSGGLFFMEKAFNINRGDGWL